MPMSEGDNNSVRRESKPVRTMPSRGPHGHWISSKPPEQEYQIQAQAIPAITPELGNRSSQSGPRALILGFLGSNLFALFIGGIYEYVALNGLVSTEYSWTVLVFLWLVGLVGIVMSEVIWGRKLPRRIIIGILSAVILAGTLSCFHLLVQRVVVNHVSPPLSDPNPVPLNGLTNAELRKRVSILTAKMFAAQAKNDAEANKKFWEYIPHPVNPTPEQREQFNQMEMKSFAERQAILDKMRGDFSAIYRPQVIALRNELMSRLPPQPEPDWLVTIALKDGLLVGIKPLSDVSDYLNRLAEQLPDS